MVNSVNNILLRDCLTSKICAMDFSREMNFPARINICYSGILNEQYEKNVHHPRYMQIHHDIKRAWKYANSPTSFCELSIFSAVGPPSRLSTISCLSQDCLS